MLYKYTKLTLLNIYFLHYYPFSTTGMHSTPHVTQQKSAQQFTIQLTERNQKQRQWKKHI